MNTTKKTVRVHNLLLLDESGSMENIYYAALSGGLTLSHPLFELSRFSLNGIKLNAFVCLFGFKPYTKIARIIGIPNYSEL